MVVKLSRTTTRALFRFREADHVTMLPNFGTVILLIELVHLVVDFPGESQSRRMVIDTAAEWIPDLPHLAQKREDRGANG